MKSVIKTALLVLFILTTSIPGIAYARTSTVFSEDGKYYAVYDIPEEGVILSYDSDNSTSLSRIFINSLEGEEVTGTFSYPNYDNKKLGKWDLRWVFIPDNTELIPLSGTINVNVMIPINGTIRSNTELEPCFLSKAISMEVGSSYTPQILNNSAESEYTWSSSDTSVVKINKATGKMSAKGVGKALITCKMLTTYNEKFTLRTMVTVISKDAAKKFGSSDSNTIHMIQGNTEDLELNYDPDVSSLYFKSSKTSVVEVDTNTGKVTAKKPGEAYITCTLINKDYEITIIRYRIIVNE